MSLYIKNIINLTGGVDIKGPLSKGYFAYGEQEKEIKLKYNTSMETSWVYLFIKY